MDKNKRRQGKSSYRERVGEYKKNYRKRNQKDASSFLKRMRRLLKKGKQFAKRRRKELLVAAAGVLVVCSVILVVWALLRLRSVRVMSEELAAVTEATEGSTETEALEEASEEAMDPLEKDAIPEVNDLVSRYFTALAAGDTEAVLQLRDNTEEKEILRIQQNSGHIEAYENISVYTKPGLEADSYVVFAYNEVKFRDVETTLPGIQPLYVRKNEAGEYYLHDFNQDEEAAAYASTVASQEDVAALYGQVTQEYQDRIAQDEELAAFMSGYMEEIKAAVGEALQEQTESAGQAENGETGEQASGTASSSENGTGSSGGTGSGVPDSGKFQVSESVNIRRSASESSEKLAVCYPGETLEILMKQADGWTRVSYNGQTGYVKSDVLK